MGVDATVQLPPYSKIIHVADVVGKLCGCESELKPLGGSDAVFSNVQGVSYKPSTIAELAQIVVENPSLFDVPVLSVWYHFENDDDGNRCLRQRSFPRWIALFQRLADFFGGLVEYKDSNEGIDYRVPFKPLDEVAPATGKPWDTFQRRIHNLPPVSEEEVAACARLAAYQD